MVLGEHYYNSIGKERKLAMAKTNKKVVDTKTVSKKKLKSDKSITIKNEKGQDDAGKSKEIVDRSMESKSALKDEDDIYTSMYHSVGLFSRSDVRNSLYTKTFRFGYRDQNTYLGNGREYLFFTRPDLHIIQVNETKEGANMKITATNKLNPALEKIPFWVDIFKTRKNTISALQASYKNTGDKFIHLLQNQCISNLDVPQLSAEFVDTPTNAWGVGYSYRGSSESSDDGPTFSLEFKDNKYLDTYYLFKVYEEYETLKHHGVIRPALKYVQERILHDQFAIYKFIVDEDMETIIYYGKMYGVMPSSLPRDVFSKPTFDDGLSYSIDFKAAFYEEMKPDILSDFNKLSATLYNQQKYQIHPYNMILGHADMRPAVAAAVLKDTTSAAAKKSPTGYVYKLKWRGSDTI